MHAAMFQSKPVHFAGGDQRGYQAMEDARRRKSGTRVRTKTCTTCKLVRQRLKAANGDAKATICKNLSEGAARAAMMLFARRTLLAWAQKYLAKKLNETPDLEGRVGDLELALFRGGSFCGGFTWRNIPRAERSLKHAAKRISIQIQWRELFRRTLVGRVTCREPYIQIRSTDRTDSTDSDENKSRKKAEPDAILNVLRQMQRVMPFRLHLLEATDGRVEYLSQHTSPPFQLVLDRVSLSAVNLTNIPATEDSTAARISVEGTTTGRGHFWMRLFVPSLVDSVTFDLQAAIEGVNLVNLNDVLRAFAKFDVKRGTCSVYSEFKVENGHYRGHVKPQFRDLDVFAWQKEHSKGLLQICRQALIALVANVFKNRPRDELSLDIGITGTFEDADVDVWSAVGSLLANAFHRSFITRAEEPKSDASPTGWRRLIPLKATAEVEHGTQK
jgi:hypothetical protein